MSSIGAGSPCDTSANQINSLIQTRLNLIQSNAVTHSPGYGFPNVLPQRLQLNCMPMTFSQAQTAQIAYKAQVIANIDQNSFIPTKQQKMTRIFNGFTAKGQPSTQYATQNWNYTNPNTRNTTINPNNTIDCSVTETTS